jgi:hypothetical protein
MLTWKGRIALWSAAGAVLVSLAAAGKVKLDIKDMRIPHR